MLRNVDQEKLWGWVSNFTDHPQLPSVTNSALIRLEDLEGFLEKIRELNDTHVTDKVDSVRIYFTRFRQDESLFEKPKANDAALGCVLMPAGGGLTQSSVAIVPTRNFSRDSDYISHAEDITRDGNYIVLMPGDDFEGTALNPPPPPTPPAEPISDK